MQRSEVEDTAECQEQPWGLRGAGEKVASSWCGQGHWISSGGVDGWGLETTGERYDLASRVTESLDSSNLIHFLFDCLGNNHIHKRSFCLFPFNSYLPNTNFIAYF